MFAKIKEIFESIQGEGIDIGKKQVFVRFCHCNLNCRFCDTDFSENTGYMNLSEEELFDKLKKTNADTISLTGGEPLLQVEFLHSFLSKYKKFLNKKIYLETNGVLYEKLSKIIDLIDEIGADIKIKSSTGEENRFYDNEKFLAVSGCKAFAKVVFTEDIKEDEINSVLKLVIKFNIPLILQPKSPLSGSIPYMEIYNKFYEKYKNIRLIPQTHKFLGID